MRWAARLLSLGELDASRQHFDAALAAYDEEHPQRSALGSDLGVFAHAWYSHTLWLLGEENAALAHAEQAIALRAAAGSHVPARPWRLHTPRCCTRCASITERVLDCAEAAVALCERYGFAYYGDWAQVLIGWARGQERPAEGVEIIESALERLDRNRAQARRPYYLSLLAETYRPAGGSGSRGVDPRCGDQHGGLSVATCGGFPRCISRRASSSRA